MQGVTGGADTSGISDKKSRGERKAKSRQTGLLSGAGGGGGGGEGGGSILGGAEPNPGITSTNLALPRGYPSLWQAQVTSSRTRVALGG